jgi:hypothetical protein
MTRGADRVETDPDMGGPDSLRVSCGPASTVILRSVIGQLGVRLMPLAFALGAGSLMWTSSTSLAAGVQTCGIVEAYTAANGEQQGVLSLRTAQATVTYLLSGGGSRGPHVDPVAVAHGASACASGELVTSARPPSHEVLIDYDIVSAAGRGLPNTSTADQIAPELPLGGIVGLVAVGVVVAWLVSRRWGDAGYGGWGRGRP